jgi:hypothetical protein
MDGLTPGNQPHPDCSWFLANGCWIGAVYIILVLLRHMGRKIFPFLEKTPLFRRRPFLIRFPVRLPGGSGSGAGGGCCEMGGGECESCATWSEHYYWNHTSDDKKQFLVVASGDFRHSMVIKTC